MAVAAMLRGRGLSGTLSRTLSSYQQQLDCSATMIFVTVTSKLLPPRLLPFPSAAQAFLGIFGATLASSPSP